MLAPRALELRGAVMLAPRALELWGAVMLAPRVLELRSTVRLAPRALELRGSVMLAARLQIRSLMGGLTAPVGWTIKGSEVISTEASERSS